MPVRRRSAAARPLAVHPEIDAITIGVVGLGGTVLKRSDPTRNAATATEAVAICAAVIEGMRSELDALYRTVGIGVAVPGLVRERDGLVRLAPHLGWVDEPLARMLAEATGYPVVAANDASLGALAESTFGAGRDVSDLIYLNGGASGIGGGVISGGVSLAGIAGYAGEFGHTLVNSAGVICHCGAVGCLETEVARAPLPGREAGASADPGGSRGSHRPSHPACVRPADDRRRRAGLRVPPVRSGRLPVRPDRSLIRQYGDGSQHTWPNALARAAVPGDDCQQV